jgi:hypothetical protein
MTGAAQHWYYMLERDGGVISWSHFKALCQQRFGPAMGFNHLADLARIPFRSSVSDYIEVFQARLAHAGYLTPEHQARLFSSSLPDSIRIVELQAPQDLQRAMALARAYERRAATFAQSAPPRPSCPQPQPLPLPAPTSNTATSATPQPSTMPAEPLRMFRVSRRRR